MTGNGQTWLLAAGGVGWWRLYHKLQSTGLRSTDNRPALGKRRLESLNKHFGSKETLVPDLQDRLDDVGLLREAFGDTSLAPQHRRNEK